MGCGPQKDSNPDILYSLESEQDKGGNENSLEMKI